MDTQNTLTCSIAIHNPDLLKFKKMLSSLRKYTPELIHLVVIDNGCEANDYEIILETIFPDLDIEVVNFKENQGFNIAHNIACERAKGKFFAVLNDDIEFFENWSTPMIEKLNIGDVMQVGPKQGVCNFLNPDGTAGWVDTDTPDYIEGSCFMMFTSIAKAYGPFDLAYKFAYWEDTDLSMRLKKNGSNIGTVDINWKHHRATTSSQIDTIDLEGYHVINERLFKQRWQSFLLKKRFGKTIVVKRTGSYGDVFLLAPVLKALKNKYKDCVIVLMSSFPEVLALNPVIDGFVKVGIPVFCDMIIDFDFSYEKNFTEHIVDSYARIAGVEVESKVGEIFVSEDSKEKIGYLIKKSKLEPSKYVTFDLSTTWKGKQYPKEYYAKVIKLVKELGYQTVGVGSTKTYMGDIGLDHNFINVITPMETSIILANAGCHVGHEGLLIHFCQAMNKNHVVMYGCTTPEFVNDVTLPSFKGLLSLVACHGCRHRFCAGTTIVCRRNYICMKSIEPELVYNKVKELLNEN